MCVVVVVWLGCNYAIIYDYRTRRFAGLVYNVEVTGIFADGIGNFVGDFMLRARAQESFILFHIINIKAAAVLLKVWI